MRKPALAASVAVLLSLLGSNAAALSLGRITVLSTLGQPLRAEIEIPEINAEEADTLKGSVASSEAFRSAGLDYNPAINNLQVSLQRRADGRMFLKLSGDRVVNDPFVDLILEANWASGRILRDYTLLFDPPSLRDGAAPAPTTAQVTTAPTTAVTPPARQTSPPVARDTQASAPARAQPQRPAPASTARSAEAPAVGQAKQITVRPGDTASKIAGIHKAPSVSLDQMLVALLRTNPDAFAGNNINRLKAGAVLDIPSADQAAETSREEAVKTVVAQSKDFNDFRRQLAGAPAATAVAAGDRQAGGKIQAQVEDKKVSVVTPDKLTLSKATPQAKALEDKVAAQQQAKEAAARTAELSRNIAELNKLKAGAASLPTPAQSARVPATPAAGTPVAAASANISPAVPGIAPPSVASQPGEPAVVAAMPVAPTSAQEPAQQASTPVAPKPVRKAAAAKPVEEPSFIDDLIANPLIPAAALGIAALLAGFAVYRTRQRKRSKPGDSSFLDSHLQPDSFFGASGGEQVDTSNEASVTGSSMNYSPSQLDAGGDVDPVAEADVYLAYGRDQQAEDILKDALQATPSRIAIHSKLADIYSTRGDAQAFNAIASTAYTVSQGQGTEWEHIRDLGKELDRGNALYQQGGPATAPRASTPVQTPVDAKSAAPADLDLDFDLDFDPQASQASDSDSDSDSDHPSAMGTLHEDEVHGESDEPIALYDAPREHAASVLPKPGEMGLGAADKFKAAVSTAAIASEVKSEMPTPVLPTPSEQTAPIKIKSHTATSPAPAAPPEMLSFDMNALSLDLNPAAPEAAPAQETDTDHLDPLATKLALAKEFQSIGDNDGAHALAEEVYSQASGQLRADAKRFLSELGFAQSTF